LAYVTRTTLSVDDPREIFAALTARLPTLAGPELRGLCYATQDRQDAVRELAGQVALGRVLGSANRSHSNLLRDPTEEIGVPAHLIVDAKGIQPVWFNGIASVGMTAGASAPEGLVQGVVEAIGKLRATSVEVLQGSTENTRFKLPPEVTGEKHL